MSYFDMSEEEKRSVQQLILHSFISEGIDQLLPSDDVRMLIIDEMYYLEWEERYEDAALYRDVLKIYDQQIAERKQLYNR